MFTTSDGKKITLAEGATQTTAWRTANPTANKAIFIGSDHISDILNQTSCVGIRMYFAKDDKGKDTVVLIGAKADESDMEAGHIVNFGISCPSTCANGALDT